MDPAKNDNRNERGHRIEGVGVEGAEPPRRQVRLG